MLAFLILVVGFLAFDASTRVALYVTPVWFALLSVSYWYSRNRGRLGVGVVPEADWTPLSRG